MAGLKNSASAMWQPQFNRPNWLYNPGSATAKVYSSLCHDCQYPFVKASTNFNLEEWRKPSSYFHSSSLLIRARRGTLQNDNGSFKLYAKGQNISTVHPGQKHLLSKESISTNAKKFLFHTEGGGQVNAIVEQVDKMYAVEIKVSLLDKSSTSEHHMFLHWGLFRSDSSDWVLLEAEAVPAGTSFANGKNEAMQTPMQLELDGVQKLRIELNADSAPFFISFVLFKPSGSKDRQEWIRSSTHTNFSIPVGLERGRPEPLGLSYQKNDAANFSLYSKNATNVTLCLYKAGDTQPSLEIDLDPILHRTGDVWHVQLQSVERFAFYGYRCKGEISWESGNRFHARNVLLDPYAKVLASFRSGEENLTIQGAVLGSLKRTGKFNWEDDCHPCIPLESLLAYKLNVEGFTKDESSGIAADLRGTLLGVTEKIPYLIDLGINAVILQPLFACDQNRGPFYPFNFFVPMEFDELFEDSIPTSGYFKQMVKELHKNGIEVILDVVYSHTAENGDESPENISFRGIDNATYYVLDQYGKIAKSEYGTENTFNCNHPAVHEMILDSLRYWVQDYHVDGFCFMHAPALVIGPHRQTLSRPLLIEAISFDPVLAKTKLIADLSSPLTRNCKEMVFPHWRRWSELNYSFCDDVRRFVRGEKGQLSSFATRLCGSGDLFADGRGPSFSMNLVSSYLGLTLADLVSYSDSNILDTDLSWNCGEEGPTDNLTVLDTRVKQVRNFLMILFLSQGVPVLNMGDEYGHSKVGTCEMEGRSSCFHWDALQENYGQEIARLIASLSRFRLRYKDLLQRSKFLKPEELTWHGSELNSPSWENHDSCFLAMSLQQLNTRDEVVPMVNKLYMAFNSHDYAVNATLPELPQGIMWHQIADTSLPYPKNFLTTGKPIFVDGELRTFAKYEVQPFSVILLEALSVEYDSKIKPSSSIVLE
ncbi:hypothetical protein O6H91_10G068100 [Diphasiastrum complanatum]|uniref:Uncharacterized protein n=1 Tax=Diphasiastrum complanatum TaxID=34168 RepID=A0ACC2CI10_DIPCM|nr:hypothetical protein O6H91_10G068100 [Diphasiastrum complanatum]